MKEIERIISNSLRDDKNYNVLARKTELYTISKLYNSFSGGIFENKEIRVTDKELAEKFNVSQSYISQNMNNIILALGQVQIRSFTPGKKMRSKRVKGESVYIPNLDYVNLTQSGGHKAGEGYSYIEYSNKFAEYIFLCAPVLYPDEILAISRPLDFDLAYYFYNQLREKPANTFKIKLRTIYNTLQVINRYEYVRDHHNRRYKDLIYKPFERALAYLGNGTFEDEKQKNSLNLMKFKYENYDFANGKTAKTGGNYDFEKWLDTNLVITVTKTPTGYDTTLRPAREKHRKLAEKRAEKPKQKAIDKQEYNKQESLFN